MARKQLSATYNLAALRPDLASEWHPTKNGILTPEKTYPRSEKKIWWICPKGHQYSSTPMNRNGPVRQGCPFCAGKKVGYGNSLRDTYPSVAQEWHPTKNCGLLPEQVSPGANKKVWWKCVHSHEWKAVIQSRTGYLSRNNKEKNVQGSGCPVCWAERRKPGWAAGKDSIFEIRPELELEWNYEKNVEIDTGKIAFQSSKTVWWKCSRGHEWRTSVAARVGSKNRKGTNCPKCNDQTSLQEIRLLTELSTVFELTNNRDRSYGVEIDILLKAELKGDLCAIIAVEYDGGYYHASDEKRRADKEKSEYLSKQGVKLFRVRDSSLGKLDATDIIHEKDAIVVDDVKSLLQKLQGYFNFSSRQLEKIEQYLAECEFAADDAYLKRLAELPGPPYEESLENLHPKVAAEWHPTKNGLLLPKHVRPGSGQKIWWQCEFGHEWKTNPAHRTLSDNSRGSKATNCPGCAGKMLTGDNNLAHKFPEIASQWHPTKNGHLKPVDIIAQSNQRFWWTCSKGHEWDATAADRVAGRGCGFCANKRVNAQNSLAALYPELLEEWDYEKNTHISPHEITPGSAKKAHWVCKNCDREWSAIIRQRTHRNARGFGSGCFKCSYAKRDGGAGPAWQGKRCLAKTRRGTLCQRPVKIAGRRCGLHGGTKEV